MSFRLAFCSEVFKTPIEETIRQVADVGFEGIEIAPYNVAESVDDVPVKRRNAIRKAADDAGIEIVGLHWLLVSPPGLHVTQPDAAVRRRTAEYLKSLVHFCADLGGKVMIFGSPRQRSFDPDDNPQAAVERAVETYSQVGDTLSERDVKLYLEALSPAETNFMQTVEEAIEVASAIDHSHVGYMLDCKAMDSMPRGILGTIEEHGEGAGHFHANEPSGLGPGMGALDFEPILKTLDESGYEGWVSVEPFQYEPDAVTIAKTALRTLKSAMAT